MFFIPHGVGCGVYPGARLVLMLTYCTGGLKKEPTAHLAFVTPGLTYLAKSAYVTPDDIPCGRDSTPCLSFERYRSPRIRNVDFSWNFVDVMPRGFVSKAARLSRLNPICLCCPSQSCWEGGWLSHPPSLILLICPNILSLIFPSQFVW